MMSDYISREAAIREQKRFCGYLDNDMLNRLEYATSKIPAADVAPAQHGRWITALTDDNGFWANYCDQCNTYLPYGIEWFPNFCPNCGARMEES